MQDRMGRRDHGGAGVVVALDRRLAIDDEAVAARFGWWPEQCDERPAPSTVKDSSIV